MDTQPATSSLSQRQVVDLYFMEHRAKLIDIAAFLDRLDRAQRDEGASGEDFRVDAFRRAMHLLVDSQPHRARRVLELFSDMTNEPIAAAGIKGAYGAAPDPGRDPGAAG